MKTFNDWMNEGRRSERFRYFNQRVICADGFSISIQANNGAYCHPRKDLEKVDGYSSFELGFPSEKDESIMTFAEDEDRPTDTVYGYVPRDVVEKLITSHGGITALKEKSA